MDSGNNPQIGPNKLVSWLSGHLMDWRDSRDDNYIETWKEYEALLRGEWRA